jgi:hypothetical protein
MADGIKVGQAYIPLELDLSGLPRDLTQGLKRAVDRADTNLPLDVDIAGLKGEIDRILGGLDGTVDLDIDGLRNEIDGVFKDIDLDLDIDVPNVKGDLDRMLADQSLDVDVDVDDSELDDSSRWRNQGVKIAGWISAGIAAAGIWDAIGNPVTEIWDREVSFTRMSAALGLDPDEVERITGVATDIYTSAWGDSVDEVTRNLQGLAGYIDLGMFDEAELQTITTQAMDIGTAYEESFDAVVRAASNMVNNGLSPTFERAFDDIVHGFQVGANAGGEWLESLTEYAEPIASLGIMGGQLGDLFRQGLDAGAYSIDKLADLLKEASIKLTDGSEATSEALAAIGFSDAEIDELIAGLNAGGEAAAEALSEIIQVFGNAGSDLQNEFGFDLFGTMVEDIGNTAAMALDPLSVAIVDTTGKAAELSDSLNDNARTAFTDWQRSLQQNVIDFVEADFLPAWSSFKTALAEPFRIYADTQEWDFSSWVDGVTGFAEEHGPKVAEAITRVVEGALAVLPQLIEGAGDLLGGIVTTLANAAPDIAAALAENVGPALAAGLSNLSDLLADVFEAIAEAAPQVTEHLLDLIENAVDGLAANAGDIAANLERVLIAAVGWVTGVGQVLGERIQEWVSEAFDVFSMGAVQNFSLDPILTAISDAIVAGTPVLVTTLNEWVTAFVDWVGPMIPVVLERLGTWLGELVRWLLTDGGAAINEAMLGLIGALMDGLAGLIPAILVGLGTFILGFLDGLTDGWVSAGLAWVAGLVDAIVGFITGLPGHFASMGTAISTGLSNLRTTIVNGVRGMWDSLWDGFRAIINRIIDAWNGLSFSVPSFTGDWNGPLAGGEFTVGGMDLGVPQIPRLAKGGVLTEPTLAMLAEVPSAQPEIVTPERLMREIVEDALAGSGGRDGITVNQHFAGSRTDPVEVERAARRAVRWAAA